MLFYINCFYCPLGQGAEGRNHLLYYEIPILTWFEYFRNLKTLKCMKRPMEHITAHRPEVILNNFTTRLGHGIARLVALLAFFLRFWEGKSLYERNSMSACLFVPKVLANR